MVENSARQNKNPNNNKNDGYPDIDADLLIGNVVEVVPNILYFACFNEEVEEQVVKGKISYVSFHGKFHYEPFYEDFGPWNLSVLYRLCVHIDDHIRVEEKRGRKIVMYCCDKNNNEFDKVRVNCAYVLGSYLIIYQGYSADDAFLSINNAQPPKYLGFRDAALGDPSYLLHLHDVLRGVERALKLNWLDFTDFDYREYEFYEKVENGDFNWIIPAKILSFCGPHNESRIEDGYPYHSPEVYFDYFREKGVTTIVRLNARIYDAKKFTDAGFDHFDLFFVDGSTPSDEIVEKFIRIVDNAKGGVAIHCKAGLGRTGTLIACWMMKEHGMTACECMSWLRICRPGSVIGPQQRFLIDKQKMCWSLSKSNGVHLSKGSKDSKTEKKAAALNKLASQVDEISLETGEKQRNSSTREKTRSTRPNILPLRRRPITIEPNNGYVDETALDEKGRSQGDRLLALKAKHQHEKDVQKEEKRKNSSNNNGTNGRYVKNNVGSMVVPSQAYLNKNREPIMPSHSKDNIQANRNSNGRSPIRSLSGNGSVAYRTRGNASTLSRTGNERYRFQNSLLFEPTSAVFPSMATRRSDISRFSSPTTPIKPMSPATPIEYSTRTSLRHNGKLRSDDVISTMPQPQFGLIHLPSNAPHLQSSCLVNYDRMPRPLAPHNYPTRFSMEKSSKKQLFGGSASTSSLPRRQQ